MASSWITGWWSESFSLQSVLGAWQKVFSPLELKEQNGFALQNTPNGSTQPAEDGVGGLCLRQQKMADKMGWNSIREYMLGDEWGVRGGGRRESRTFNALKTEYPLNNRTIIDQHSRSNVWWNSRSYKWWLPISWTTRVIHSRHGGEIRGNPSAAWLLFGSVEYSSLFSERPVSFFFSMSRSTRFDPLIGREFIFTPLFLQTYPQSVVAAWERSRMSQKFGLFSAKKLWEYSRCTLPRRSSCPQLRRRWHLQNQWKHASLSEIFWRR